MLEAPGMCNFVLDAEVGHVGMAEGPLVRYNTWFIRFCEVILDSAIFSRTDSMSSTILNSAYIDDSAQQQKKGVPST